MSQFDDLLGDFGGENNITTKTDVADEFDPFGSAAQNNSSKTGDSNLLLDFTADTQIQNGAKTNGVDSEVKMSGSNPLYDLEQEENLSSNPLYDLNNGSSNPLYDLTEKDEGEASNPLYDLDSQEYDAGNDILIEDDQQELEPRADSPTQQIQETTTYTETLIQETHEQEISQTEDTRQTELIEEDQSESSALIPEQTESDQLVETRTNIPEVTVSDLGETEANVPEVTIPESVETITDVPEVTVSDLGETNVPEVTISDEFGQDRREEDLEQYCIDREEPSEIFDGVSGEVGSDLASPENDASELHLREERSRSPSREIEDKEKTVEEYNDQEGGEHEKISKSANESTEDKSLNEDVENREERSRSPSRSVEPQTAQEEEIIENGRTITKTTRTENRYSDSGLDSRVPEQISSNQWVESVEVQNKKEQDAIHYNEMSSVLNKFETPNSAKQDYKQVNVQQEVLSAEGGIYENEPQKFEQWSNQEEEEEGVYESTPQKRDDVVRESDRDIGADLPAVGMASSLRAKFLTGEVESAPSSKREVTPPSQAQGGGEYVSEPRSFVEKYEGRAESGVFESQPQIPDDVVRSETLAEDYVPEHGFAKNVAAHFKQIEKGGAVPSPGAAKREITPDRSGQVEYVSEPRGFVEKYEGHAESGVFESQPSYDPEVVRAYDEQQEELPEQGMAKNIANRFRQLSTENKSPPSGGNLAKQEIQLAAVDAGVFENQPQRNEDVVNSESVVEEYVPQRGFAKNVAAKFKELEVTAKSPPLSPGRRKEFTPPREDLDLSNQSGVYESTPKVQADVVHSDDLLEEALPERGTARNMAARFKQMEQEKRSAQTRSMKEFTPPPADSGVFENTPTRFQADYNRPAESGILESSPEQRNDVSRESEPPNFEVELPERGMARNLVSRWKQMESESAKGHSPGSGGKVKEFTPPRDEPRIAQVRSPRTPLSPGVDNGSVHPSELPGQYQPQNEPSVFESQPNQREDVYREADTDWTDGMPKKDTAKKMLARFKQIQASVKQEEPLPESRKEIEIEKSFPEVDYSLSKMETNGSSGEKEESTNGSSFTIGNMRAKFEKQSVISNRESCPVPSVHSKSAADHEVGRSKSMRAAIQTEKCGSCEKTVYAMERTEMNRRVYHKACFRCTQCKAVLTPKTFAINNEVIFCTTHYKQLFATKGNYDEGFGRTPHKKRWSSNPNLADKDQDSKTS